MVIKIAGAWRLKPKGFCDKIFEGLILRRSSSEICVDGLNGSFIDGTISVIVRSGGFDIRK